MLFSFLGVIIHVTVLFYKTAKVAKVILLKIIFFLDEQYKSIIAL